MSGRPNLLFIFADAFRFSAAGARAGFDPVLTPNLNRLASQGATLTHAVSNFPLCSPYRAMLLTGQYPFRNGVTGNCCSMPGCENNYLRPDAPTFTDALASAGYSIGYVGKWHLEKPQEPYIGPADRLGYFWNEFTPPERRHGVGFWCAYNTYDNHFQPEYWITGMPRSTRHRADAWSPKFETDVGLAFLENDRAQFRRPDEPFALFLSFNPPHTPFEQVPPDLLTLYNGRRATDLLVRPNVDFNDQSLPSRIARHYVSNYFAMITGIDAQVGRMLEALDSANLADDTLVVFTSDHGEMMGSQRLMYKGFAYDESIRVPFFARLPGKIPAGHVSDALLSAPDVMPTLLDTLGLADHTPAGIEGVSRAGELDGSQRTSRADSSFLLNPADGWRGVRTERYTFTFLPDQTTGAQLFDNLIDPYQMHDCASEFPEIVEQLRRRTLTWMRDLGDPASSPSARETV